MKNQISRAIKLNDNKLLITEQLLKKNTQKASAEMPAHHIFIIDCSGSMYNELADIRSDLYNKISTLLKPNDSISIVWFSGKGQYGILLEDFKINSSVSLNNVRKKIDSELVARGLTAFKEPLMEAREIIARISRNPKTNYVYSLFFITDGHDNSWPENEIISEVKKSKDSLVSATVVEYGYYCNKALLNKMASEFGGVHLFAKDFQDYEPYMEKQFKQSIEAKREYFTLSEKPKDGFVFFIDSDNNVISLSVDSDNRIFISPEETSSVFYITDNNISVDSNTYFDIVPFIQNMDYSNESISSLYATMYAYSRQGDFNTISEILRVLGDAYFIERKANTFGIQKINELEEEFLDVIKNPTENAFRNGYNPNLEPKEDAYCVMDMINDLMNSEENLWYPSKLREYKRTGRKAVRIDSNLTDEEKQRVNELLEENKIAEAQTYLEEVRLKKEENKVEFENIDYEKGFQISNLTWNGSKANLSVQVRYNGFVQLPNNGFNLPEKFETFIYRNYNIINNGIINNYELPVSLSRETFNKLQENGLFDEEIYSEGEIYYLNFKSLPVINQKMIKSSSAETLFKSHHGLFKIKAQNSVFNFLKKEFLDGLSKGFVDTYGQEATEWLKSLGITETSGFAPKRKLENPSEETMVAKMEIKIDKLTSLPTAKDVYAKIKDGKDMTDRELFLKPYFDDFFSFYKLVEGIGEDKKNKMIQDWIEGKSKSIRQEKNKLSTEISKAIFLTIVGKSWFNDLKSREDKEMIVEIDNQQTKFIIKEQLEKVEI